MEKIKIGITQGDINGIGYELIIKTLLDNRILDFCTPIVYGSAKVLAYHRKVLNVTNFSLNNVKSIDDINPKRGNVINCTDEEIRVELGKSTSEGGNAAFTALECAITDLKANKIDVLLTAPINKDNIQSDKFKFPGHTEYLQEKFDSKDVLMLLVSDTLRVGVVTGHIPVAKISEAITQEAIIEKLRILNKSLIQDFSIRKPKIAVLGLNPHAGDNGVIGSEELDIIIPAIEQARNENIMAIGPYPADGLFGSSTFMKFDAILAMYHDQGLAPFKALAFDSGVNFTAGLPIIRTSPAHGTAYDITGQNIADINSFKQALYLAIDVYKNRKENIELNKNSL